MIDIARALDGLPHFDGFPSVAETRALAESLRDDPRFTVEVAGTSANGLPIHHIRFGKGSVKALFAAFVHCPEPIGGLTVHGMIDLLRQGHPAVADADVEWHFVPCADPDGALLNEDWTQQPFSLQSYMRGLHNQEQADQIDGSFPIRYKNLVFDQPTPEAKVLQGVIDKVRPDVFFSLHNAFAGGTFFALKHDIGADGYQAFYDLLEANGIPLQKRIYHAAFFGLLSEGVLHMGSLRDIYDLIEKSGAAPETILRCGGGSWDRLAEINPAAQVVVVEMPYLTHPVSASTVETRQNMRQLKLRIDAELKYVATAILEEWDRTKDDLDAASPFYRKILKGMVDARDTLHEGLPFFAERTRDLLFNPAYSRNVTEGERFENHVIHFWTLCNTYAFVRLLKASRQTDAVKAAIACLDPIFDEALAGIAANIEADRLAFVDHDRLARVQLGAGLIALNARLAEQRAPEAALAVPA
jgi:hypothetical protein